MRKTNYDKMVDSLSRRFKNYECEGQMTMFDVDWKSINGKDDEIGNQIEEYENCM